MSTQSKTPADTMAVAQRGVKPAIPATALDKEVKFLAFASDVEVRLTLRMVIDHICIPTKTGHKCTESEAMKFMMMCSARRLNPWEGDAFIQGYDGKHGPVFSLITAHQAFLKRAEASEHYDGMQSGVLVRLRGDPDDKGNTKPIGDALELEGDFYLVQTHTLVGAWARVHLKNRKFPVYRRLDIEVFDQQFGRWEKDPAGMMVKCAEADALRSAFPSVLGGLYLAQELKLGGEKNITPAPLISAPPFISQPPPTELTRQGAEAPRSHSQVIEPEPEKQIDDTEAKAADEAAAAQEDPLAPTTAKPAYVDKCDGLEGKQVLDLLKQTASKDGIGDDQLTGYCRSVKLAKSSQHWPELADSKLRKLINEWEQRLPQIRQVAV